MATSQFGSQQGCTGPWGSLNASYSAPSSFTGRRNSTVDTTTATGNPLNRAGKGVDPHELKMTPENRERSQVAQGSNSSGEGTPIPTQPITFQEPLDLSGVVAGGHRQFEGAADERQTPNPHVGGDGPPPQSSADVEDEVPADLSQRKKMPNFDDNLFSAAEPPKDMKEELDDLQEKLNRSRDDYSRRVFQNDRYTREETLALLKAILWRCQLEMKLEDLPMVDLPARMKSTLFWDSSFRGQGSLLDKFREYLGGGIRNRDGASLKRKWERIFNGVAMAEHEFDKPNVVMMAALGEMEAQDKKFLVQLAKEYCAMKGVQLLPAGPQPSSSSWTVPAAAAGPNPSGNPFQDKDAFQNWRMDESDNMSVFSAIVSEWSRLGSV